MKDAVGIIKYAMEMEKNGQRFYNSFKDQVKNPKAKNVFDGLAKAEEEHYEILARELNNLQQKGTWSQVDPLSFQQTDIFELAREEENLHPGKLVSEISDLAIMRMAYLIEHDFAAFYRKMLEQIQDEQGSRILHALIRMEEEHERFFYEEYRKIMEETWNDAQFYPF